MNHLSVIFKAILLHKDSISEITRSASYKIWANIFIVMIGIMYGVISYIYMPSELFLFETNLLKSLMIIVIIIISLFMVFLTRLCLTFLLWAGGRAFGGPGLLSKLSPLTSFALIPTIIGFPSVVYLNNGESLSFVMIATLFFSIIWVFLFSTKVIEVTQNFQKWKAYTAVFAVFIFFASVFYITLPPTNL